MSTVKSGDETIIVCDRNKTAKLLSFEALVDAIANAAKDLERGEIISPERMVVPLGTGVLLSMPATGKDIGIHKLVNVHPENPQKNLPSIHGMVTVCDAESGRIKCLLDGPELTGRRTAAVSLLAMRTFLKEEPKEILIYGTGIQARYHLQAIQAIHPNAKVLVKGLNEQYSIDFCNQARHLHPHIAPCGTAIPESIDVVITLTTSNQPIYNEIAKANRLVIGVGAFTPDMAEIGCVTLDGSDIYGDDLVGVRAEAGDLIQANVDWTRVSSLASALSMTADSSRPIVFKTVGTGAWDLAAGRVAIFALESGQ